MITIKKPEEIVLLREGGARHASILRELAEMVKPGLAIVELDRRAAELIAEQGDESSFLNFQPYGARRPYPAHLCVSINEEIVHGIPTEGGRVLKEGDIVSLDLGLIHKGLYTDAAVTVAVGTVSPEVQALLRTNKEALMAGIQAAKNGNRIGDISHAIQQIGLKAGYGVVEELAGHGVGYDVHEDPYVPNHGAPGTGPLLKPGMVLAIEPIFNLGTKRIKLDADGYTYKTADGKLSSHFEHTVLITEKGAEILTK